MTPEAAENVVSEFATEPVEELRGATDARPGTGPYRLAWKRLKRNKVSLFFLGLFALVVIICLLAPVYAKHVAHTNPNSNHITDQITVRGELKDVVDPGGIPIGPTWSGRFFLGADGNGRDVAVRLLYGGRNSLEIGLIASLITVIFAAIFGLLSGYLGGRTDTFIVNMLDLIWAFPVVLLGVALGVSLAVGGINLGIVNLRGNSMLVPAIIIGVVYIPYIAKPLRGQVLQLSRREFVDAARAQGLGDIKIMFSEIMPNIASTMIVLFPLVIANSILLEAALSFLGAGVQDPNPSWGTMIGDGIRLIPSAFHLTIVPGLMLVVAILGVNVFGDGLRDALDPRSSVRIER
jgi:peptide/nickel transport system permease protein